MKNATLWKRVLHEGITVGTQDADVNKSIAGSIILSTIIIDPRPLRTDRGDLKGLPDISGVAFPYEYLWIEGNTFGPHRTGTYIRAKRTSDGHEIGAIAIYGSPRDGVVFSGMLAARFDTLGNPVADSLRWTAQQASLDFAGVDPVTASEVNDLSSWTIVAALDTLMTLGCKNVSIEARDGDERTARIARKRHGPNASGFRYHVLVVRPAGGSANAPGFEIGIMPQHMCRGHYQHYGPAAIHRHPDGQDRGLLFGRTAGKFFVPPVVKGDKKNGIVEKDYEVRAPAMV